MPRQKVWLIIVICLLASPGLLATGSKARDVIWDQEWYAPTKAWVSHVDLGPQTAIGILGSTITPNIYPPFPFLWATVVNLNNRKPGNALPRFVLIDNSIENLHRWIRTPLSKRYRLVHSLGYREAWSRYNGWVYPSESRLAGWVYEIRPQQIRLE